MKGVNFQSVFCVALRDKWKRVDSWSVLGIKIASCRFVSAHYFELCTNH